MRKWLSEKRKSKELSQKEVAEQSGITDAYYCFIETGQRNPSVSIAKKIAKVLNFEWTLFFEDKTNETLVKASETKTS